MMIVLVLSAIPAVLAAGLNSAGLALLAGAGVMWAAALYACSVAPVVDGRAGSLNETVAAALSTLAAALATSGALMMVLPALSDVVT